MGDVVKFKTKFQGLPQDDNIFLVGWACAICDVYNSCGEHEAVQAVEGSGLMFDDFKNAGCEDYDLETLEKIYSAIA